MKNNFMSCVVSFMTLFVLTLTSCSSASAKTETEEAATDTQTPSTTMANENINTADTSSVKVKMVTSMGDVEILLYGDTPRHRDNFVKLVKEGYYNGTLFHRVISEFMIQAGDPDSKNAAPGQRLGAGGPNYTIEAEINFPKHFHKRGALAAARQGDQVNPEKRSSGSQFYVVTGRKLLPGQLDQLKNQLKNQQLQSTFNGLAAQHMNDIRSMQMSGDQAGLKALQDSLIAETEKIVAENPLTITPEMEQAYTTVGGAPHLDGAYTVFGEVLSGMDVIDKIEKVETDGADRPKEDVKIISMEIVK